MEIDEFYAAEIPKHQYDQSNQDDLKGHEPGLIASGQIIGAMKQIYTETQWNEQVGNGPEIVGIDVMDVGDHTTDVSDGMIHIICPEKDPGEGYQQEGNEDLKDLFDRWVPFAGSEIIPQIGPIFTLQERRDEQQGMDATPGDEGPVGTVPESADQEDDEDIANRFPEGRP